MKKQILRRARAILPTTTAALLAVLAASTTAHAQTATTWTGAANGNWTDSGNWNNGVPAAGFNAIFGANVGGDPNQYYTLAMDKITFAAGFSAGHTLQFGGATGGWNVNTAGTFIEVQATNSGAQQLNVSRNNGQPITLQSGTSTILNNGSGGLTVGSSFASGGGKIQSASGLNSTLVVDGSGTTTIGPISGGGFTIADNGAGVLSLTKNGTGGALNLSGNNTFSGGLTLQGTGAINLSHSNAAGTGTIFLKYASSSFVATTLGLSGGITVTNAINIDSTTGREAISSTGTGNNSLTGGITITGAGANSITINNNQSSGNLTVSGGISGASYGNNVSLRGSQSGNVGFLNGTVTLAANAFFDNNGATSWTINGTGSTWGQTLVRSTGNLILGTSNALATGSRIVFDTPNSTGGVDLNGFNQTVAGIETTVAITTGNGGLITNNGAANSTLTLAGLAGNATFNGTITDGATSKISLVMNSSNRTQTLNGSNTYSGSTTVSAGTLALGTNLALQNSALDTSGAGTVSLASGVTTPSLGGLSGNKTLSSVITGNYSLVTALTVNPGTGATNTYSGNITNGAAGMTLTKTGNGTQILAGTNTYTGNTTVSAGTLLINGSTSASSGVSVSAGATLGGNGTIGGATTITGILAPGNSIGTLNTLNLTSNVTWVGAASAGATTNWLFELGTSNTSDKLNITGNFLKDTSLGTTFMFDFAGGANQGTFTLVDWTGTTGFNVGDFSYTNLGGGLTGTFNFNGSQLDFIAVPEPSTALSMVFGLAIAGFLMHRRRRHLD